MIANKISIYQNDKLNALNKSSTRVAFFLPNLRGGGAERVQVNLANGISERGFAVDIVAASAEGVFLGHIHPMVNVVNLHSPRIVKSILPLVRYLNTVKPNVLVAAIHGNFAAVAASRLSKSSTRIVVTQHSHMSSYATSGNWKVRIEPELARRTFTKAHAIIAVSQGVAQDMSTLLRIPRSAIQVIYNPVITPELSEKKTQSAPHVWFSQDHSPVIVAVGRLVDTKCFDELLTAFSIVHFKTPARLIILGEGPERTKLERLVHDLNIEDAVSLPGFVDNPYSYLAQADLFVLSSSFEGLPTALVEALYCGTSVVSTDCPSGPYEILDGGRYGHLVPTHSPVELAAAILRSLQGDIPRPASDSWQPYEMNHVIDQYLDLLLDNQLR